TRRSPPWSRRNRLARVCRSPGGSERSRPRATGARAPRPTAAACRGHRGSALPASHLAFVDPIRRHVAEPWLGARQPVFQVEDRVDGTGVDVVLHREIAADPIPHVHQVEQLREAPLTLRLDRQHLMEALADDLASHVEAGTEPRVLEAMAELDERDELPSDVAVLTPR